MGKQSGMRGTTQQQMQANIVVNSYSELILALRILPFFLVVAHVAVAVAVGVAAFVRHSSRARLRSEQISLACPLYIYCSIVFSRQALHWEINLIENSAICWINNLFTYTHIDVETQTTTWVNNNNSQKENQACRRNGMSFSHCCFHFVVWKCSIM